MLFGVPVEKCKLRSRLDESSVFEVLGDAEFGQFRSPSGIGVRCAAGETLRKLISSNVCILEAKGKSVGGPRRSFESSSRAPLDLWRGLWDHLGVLAPSKGAESSQIGPKSAPN